MAQVFELEVQERREQPVTLLRGRQAQTRVKVVEDVHTEELTVTALEPGRVWPAVLQIIRPVVVTEPVDLPTE